MYNMLNNRNHVKNVEKNITFLFVLYKNSFHFNLK